MLPVVKMHHLNMEEAPSTSAHNQTAVNANLENQGGKISVAGRDVNNIKVLVISDVKLEYPEEQLLKQRGTIMQIFLF